MMLVIVVLYSGYMLVKSLADLVSDLMGLAHDRNTGRVNICQSCCSDFKSFTTLASN